MSQDTRKDKRAQDTSIVVRYKSATVDEFIEHHAHDVSRGGIFVKTTTPFGPGTLLKFELRISDDKPLIAGVGRVVWKRDPAQVGEGRPSGMGVKFIKIDEPSRVLIDEVVNKAPGAGASFTNGESRKEPANAPAPPSVVTSAPPIAALGRTPSAGAPVLPTPAAPSAEAKRIPPPPSRVPAPPSRGVTVPSPKAGGGLAPPPQRGNSERPTIAGMPVSAPAAPDPTPAPRPAAANVAPAAGTPARDSTRDLLKDPPRPVVRVAEEVKTVRRSLDSLLSEIETDTVSKTTKDVPVTAPGEPVPAAPPRATFAAARKATIMGMATPPPPAAERTSQMPAQSGLTPPPPAATMTFGDVPSRASEGEDRPEPTVMKQAAELLEEALREAGGSLDEIGNNPLFGGVSALGKQPPARDPMLTPVGDPLALTTRDDDEGLEHQERTLAMNRDAVKREFSSTMPLNRPDPALASTMLSQSQPPPAAGQPAAIGQAPAVSPSAPPPAFAQAPARVSTPPVAEKKKGSALPLILGLGVLVLLGGGGAAAWKMGYLNGVLGTGKPIPTAAPSLASAAPTIAATAPVAMPSASATADTSLDAGVATDAAAGAADASAAAVMPSAATTASAAPTATASAAPTQPKIVYRPPPPKPTATDDTNPTPPATAAATATAAPVPTATAAPASTAAAPTATAAPKPPALVPGDDLNLK